MAHASIAVNVDSTVHQQHLAIAEAGKILAIKGDHDGALQHYREAISIVVSLKAPEIFFRHYTQCVLESLELSGAHEQVIEYCEKADTHYASIETANFLTRRDQCELWERLGINLLKSGDNIAAVEQLNRAVSGSPSGKRPISEQLLTWLQRYPSLDVHRIETLQRRHDYFTVRKDRLDKNRAEFLNLNKPRKQPMDMTI